MLTLMIVDDEKTDTGEPGAVRPLEHALNIDSVRMARNGVEALALADREPPQILLTDVRMPKMDGLELAERVKRSTRSARSSSSAATPTRNT